MKKLMIALLMTSMLVVFGAGCHKDKAGDVDPDGKTGSADTGVPECDDYMKKLEACMAKTPEAGKPAMQHSLETTRDHVKQAMTPESKGALKITCKQMSETLATMPSCK